MPGPDARLRGLERAWSAGDVGAGQAYVRGRLRGGKSIVEVRALASGYFRSAGRNRQGQQRFVHIESGITMVAVPAGVFMMGSPEERGSRQERPQHRVVISRPFLISETDVTQDQWKAVMGENNNPSHFQGTSVSMNDCGQTLDPQGHPYDEHPVEGLSWDDAQTFCERTGLRLPTEAMWEYACRAGTTTRYHSGDLQRDLERVAWFDQPWDEGHRAVRLKEPNDWGLYDMHGNVFNFCQDRWHPNYGGAPENGFVAWDDDTGYNHVLWVGSALVGATLEPLDGEALEEELTYLIVHRIGHRPASLLEEEEEEEKSDERRRVAYGLDVKLAPSPWHSVQGRARAAPNMPRNRAAWHARTLSRDAVSYTALDGTEREVSADPPEGGERGPHGDSHAPPTKQSQSNRTQTSPQPLQTNSDDSRSGRSNSSTHADRRSCDQLTSPSVTAPQRSEEVGTGNSEDTETDLIELLGFDPSGPDDAIDDIPLSMPVISEADVERELENIAQLMEAGELELITVDTVAEEMSSDPTTRSAEMSAGVFADQPSSTIAMTTRDGVVDRYHSNLSDSESSGLEPDPPQGRLASSFSADRHTTRVRSTTVVVPTSEWAAGMMQRTSEGREASGSSGPRVKRVARGGCVRTIQMTEWGVPAVLSCSGRFVNDSRGYAMFGFRVVWV